MSTLDLLADETLRMLMPSESATSLTLSIPRPRTDQELLALTERYLGIQIPSRAVCKGHSAPAQAYCDAYFARAPWAVWKAARGLGGKSYLLAALAFMEALTLRTSVSVLGGSGEQSARVLEYLRQFWMKPTVPYEALSGDTSQRKTRLVWGNSVEAQLASQRSVRGAHPTRVRMDEADEMELDIVNAARGQAMDKGDLRSNVVFSSTHQNADGTMTALMREAVDKGMPIYTWCWRETVEPHGWLGASAMRRYRATVSAELWRVEVELGEPSPEGRAIQPEAIEAMFEGDPIQDREGQYLEFEPPTRGAMYATGCDWGKARDESVIWTDRVDTHPMRMVAYERLHQRPHPFMVGRLMERVRRYRGEAVHDALGIGSVEKDNFTEAVDDYQMIGKARNDLFLNFIASIERGERRAPRVLSAYHALKYATNADLFGAGHPPDPLVAGAMANVAAMSARHPLGLVGGKSAQPAASAAPVQAGSLLSQATAFLARRGNGHAGNGQDSHE